MYLHHKGVFRVFVAICDYYLCLTEMKNIIFPWGFFNIIIMIIIR